MPTFGDNEAGSSVRSKINAAITQVDSGAARIRNNLKYSANLCLPSDDEVFEYNHSVPI